jgi:hypothetical protein
VCDTKTCVQAIKPGCNSEKESLFCIDEEIAMTTTTNGTVTFIDDSSQAASSMLADMVAMENAGNSGDTTEILPLLGAITGIIGNAMAAGQMGLNAANAANGSNGALEIELRNLGTNYIAPYSYNSEVADVAAFPGPIVPGESDSFVLTHSGGFTAGSSNAKFNMLISGDTPTDAIIVQIAFSFSEGSDPGLWRFQVSVDGAAYKFASTKGVVGLQFTGSGSFPSFNIYVGSIETGGGELLVSIFDSATA